MSLKHYKFGASYIGLFILSVFLTNVLLFGGCQDVKGTKETLKINNYKPIEVGGYGWFQGAKDDVYITKFKAISPSGDTVSGVVTSGWFKGNTIRTYSK
jgi:hypothetical protein